MSTPVSWSSQASNLATNQSMPMQARKGVAKAAPAAAASPVKQPQEVKKVESAKKPATNATVPAPAAKEAPKATKIDAPAVSSPTAAGAAPAAAIAPRIHHTGYALVKAVLSGDSVVLAGSTVAGAETPEKTLTISGIQAPKFGRGKNQTDEAWAWESREYLRKLVIGQQVYFVVQHTHADSGRDYGALQLNGQDVAPMLIKAGWVHVKPGNTNKDGKLHPEKEPLVALEQEAIARGLGLHKKGVNSLDHVRTIDWTPNVQQLYAANKGKALPAVIDQVRDGSTLRVELIHPDNPLKHTMITLNLAGVSCPRTPLPLSVLQQQYEKKKAADPKADIKKPKAEAKAEPFALEAQAFTEARLLNRDVQVVLQGVDKTDNLFGTIQFAKGNISLKLLELGYGKLVPWSAALTNEAAKLKELEAKAKTSKLRLWQNYDPASAAASSSVPSFDRTEYQAKVLQVLAGDSILVEDPKGGETKLWLASIRAPRLGGKRSDKDEPFAQEAKEFLRSKLIGHKVRVVPEYVRESKEDDNRAARPFVSVFLNKTNLNESLVAAGYATPIPHSVQEDRSQFYDTYINAEAQAKAAGRGLHDTKKEHVVTRITDLTERVRIPKPKKAKKPKKSDEDGEAADGEEEEAEEKKAAPTKAETEALNKSKQLSAKAKQYLVFLQREKQVTAVVEHVFSASRFKILIPKEHVLISLSLAGIRTPPLKNADGSADVNGEAALQYVRAKTLQHTVKIEVETIDKADNYLGSLFINKVNLAVDLLDQGLASIFGFSASRSPYREDLYAAERRAKDARRGVWKDWVEPTPEEKAAKAGASYDEEQEEKTDDKQPTERVCKITEIVDCIDFFVQFVGDKNAEAIQAALTKVAELPESDEPFNPPANANGRSFVAAGQFSDDSWHRVRVDGINEDGDWRVYFIDYGNYDILVGDRLRHLPAEAQKLPALAHHCALAGLAAPKAEEYKEGSAIAFSEMAFGQDMNIKIEFTDRFSKKHVTLSHESHPISVNRQLTRDGWARVQQRPDRRIQRLVSELLEEEKYAKNHHYNLFEYGDVSDEEEGEKVPGPDPRARPGRK